MADESGVSSVYVFDRREGDEERRLEAQARAIDPLTERLFRAAATLAEGLLAETVAHNGIVIGTPLIGAWARTPKAEPHR
jgi:hypothetical protein